MTKPTLPRSQKVRPLKWRRDEQTVDGAVSFWASQPKPYNITLAISVYHTQRRGRTLIELSGWIDQSDTPLIDRAFTENRAPEEIVANISDYQKLVTVELAAALDLRANYVAGLINTSQ